MLIDARGARRFAGRRETLDLRAGHIPGAKNLPVNDLFDADTNTVQDADAIRERFAQIGVTQNTDPASVITYSGSGNHSALLLAAMEHVVPGQGVDFSAVGRVLVLVLVLSRSQSLWNIYLLFGLYAVLLLALIDTIVCWLILRRRLYKKFGEEEVKKGGTIFWYIFSRCFNLRRWRQPSPQNRRGEYPA